MGNNPIVINDCLGDSIPTKFFTSSGIQTNTIPADIQNSFQQEYGITLGYENGKLFKAGDFKTDLKVSPSAKEDWESLLGQKNPEESLYFGYNLALSKVPSINGNSLQDPVVMGAFYNKTAYIDLADFDHGDILGSTITSINTGNITKRVDNLSRIIEHEYLGHGIFGLDDDKFEQNDTRKAGQVEYCINTYRNQMGIHERDSYSFSTEKRTMPSLMYPNIIPVWKVSRDYHGQDGTSRMFYDREKMRKMENYIGN